MYVSKKAGKNRISISPLEKRAAAAAGVGVTEKFIDSRLASKSESAAVAAKRQRVAEDITAIGKGDLGRENIEALRLLAEVGTANDAYVFSKLRRQGMAQGAIAGFFEGLSSRTPFVLKGTDHSRNTPSDHRTWTMNPEFRQLILDYFSQGRDK